MSANHISVLLCCTWNGRHSKLKFRTAIDSAGSETFIPRAFYKSLWYKSSLREIILYQYYRTKKCPKISKSMFQILLFCWNKKNDKVRAIFGTYSKLIHPDCHPTLHPLFFEIQTSFLSDTFQYFEHFLIYNVSSQSVPSGPIGTTKLTKVFNLWTKISEEL